MTLIVYMQSKERDRQIFRIIVIFNACLAVEVIFLDIRYSSHQLCWICI